jgi:hypothetical protein
VANVICNPFGGVFRTLLITRWADSLSRCTASPRGSSRSRRSRRRRADGCTEASPEASRDARRGHTDQRRGHPGPRPPVTPPADSPRSTCSATAGSGSPPAAAEDQGHGGPARDRHALPAPVRALDLDDCGFSALTIRMTRGVRNREVHVRICGSRRVRLARGVPAAARLSASSSGAVVSGGFPVTLDRCGVSAQVGELSLVAEEGQNFAGCSSALPNQRGVRVSNSAASPGPIVRSLSTRTRRGRPVEHVEPFVTLAAGLFGLGRPCSGE